GVTLRARSGHLEDSVLHICHVRIGDLPFRLASDLRSLVSEFRAAAAALGPAQPAAAELLFALDDGLLDANRALALRVAIAVLRLVARAGADPYPADQAIAAERTVDGVIEQEIGRA